MRSNIAPIGDRRLKQYKYLYQRCLDPEIILQAYKKMRKGKTKRKEIIYIDTHYIQEASKIRQMLIDFRQDESAFTPPKHEPKIIYEHGKCREIYNPEIHEQWIHHIIIQVFGPLAMNHIYRMSCGSLPNRGAHSAKNIIRRWLQDYKAIKFCWKFDIRHFYKSINLDILWCEMEKMIKDNLFIRLCKRCLMHFKQGLPLGYYISQWFANYLLGPLDSLIAKLFPKYVRYMDDGVVFGGNKRKLHNLVPMVMTFLGRNFRLRLKGDWQIFRIEYIDKQGHTRGRRLDFMGFKFTRYNVTLRKRIMLNISRRAYHFSVVDKWYIKHIRAMLSGNGWLKATDSYGFYTKYIKPYVNFRKLKRIVSRIDRRERKRNDKLDTRALSRIAC